MCHGIKGWSRYKTQNSFRDDCHLFRYLFPWEVTDTEMVGKGERDAGGRNEMDVLWCYWVAILLARSHSSHLLFFLVTYCWVECNFLTLKISDWGAPTFRRQTGCRSRRERSEGWMMRKMKKSKSERERVYTHTYIYMCVRVGWANESEKKSRAERKDYIGDFGFRVSSGRKADFPIFRLSRNEDRHSN